MEKMIDGMMSQYKRKILNLKKRKDKMMDAKIIADLISGESLKENVWYHVSAWVKLDKNMELDKVSELQIKIQEEGQDEAV